jgi:hypothetical protein
MKKKVKAKSVEKAQKAANSQKIGLRKEIAGAGKK